MILLHYTPTDEGYTLHLDGDPSKLVKVKTNVPAEDGMVTSPITLVRMASVIVTGLTQ